MPAPNDRQRSAVVSPRDPNTRARSPTLPPARRHCRLSVAAAAVCLLASQAVAAQCVAPVRTPQAMPLSISYDADPAPAPVDCKGAAPAVGQSFDGLVVQVLDGHTLCVALGGAPRDWILVRLGGVPTTSARQTLMAASFARKVTCVVGGAAQRGVEARCKVDDAPLEQVIATKAARQAGLAWR